MQVPREQCYQYCETEMSAGTISTLAFLVIADMNLESSVCLAVGAEISGSTSQPLTCNCLKYCSQFHTNNSSASKISLHTLRLSKVYFQKHLKINISPRNTVELNKHLHVHMKIKKLSSPSWESWLQTWLSFSFLNDWMFCLHFHAIFLNLFMY